MDAIRALEFIVENVVRTKIAPKENDWNILNGWNYWNFLQDNVCRASHHAILSNQRKTGGLPWLKQILITPPRAQFAQ
jgi:hypothetical protein